MSDKMIQLPLPFEEPMSTFDAVMNKGALLDAINNMCLEMLQQQEESDLLEKEEIEYIEEWYAKLQSDKPVSITELEKVLDYTSERYWHLEREVFIHEHTIKV